MRVMTRRNEQMLDALIELAGDSETVVRVLRRANARVGPPPTLREVVRLILQEHEGCIPRDSTEKGT